MTPAAAALLEDGQRLHLQHGPIDLIVSADTAAPGDRTRAFAAARARFSTVLEELVAELPILRAELLPGSPVPRGSVAGRMDRAARPYAGELYLSRMAAVAGAVADEVLAALRAAAPLERAHVNNGGDIALHLGAGASYRAAMAGLDGTHHGRIEVRDGDGIGGIATSGAGGRSHSFGIADSVTVLAPTAAEADVAATLIANAVDLPGDPRIQRTPAMDLNPDSDLGDRLVVTAVPELSPRDRGRALTLGADRACRYIRAGRIAAAALCLQGEQILLGEHLDKAIVEDHSLART